MSLHRGGKRGRQSGIEPSGPRTAWLVTRLLAMILLFGASGLLYHVATSDEFRIARVQVAGNRLLSINDLQAAAAVYGANIFWVRQEEVRQRLQALPAVQSARVTAFLPNRLEIRIGERTPVAIWQVDGAPLLVDDEGRILGSSAEFRQLPVIQDLDRSGLRAGAQVDADALRTTFRLQRLLPEVAKTSPREFEYSRDTGVSVVTDFGPRVRFGRGEDLEWKVTALVAVRGELERSGGRAELIDLRFKDRPYVR